jgi:hypothetical protein
MTRPDELKAALANAQAVYDQAAKHESLSASVMLADLRLLIDAARQAEAWREVALAERERCAVAISPQSERPCDCNGCTCRNQGEAERVAQWDADMDDAKIIRALPAPEPNGT